MTGDEWIVIPGWRKFQHYSGRRPPWIKVYVDLLDNPRWLQLSGRRKGILFSLWLLYAIAEGEVPASPTHLNRSFGFPSEWEHRKAVENQRLEGESRVRAGREQGERVGEGQGEWPVRHRDIKALEQAGFIQLVASRALAKEAFTRARATRDRDREETSKEETDQRVDNHAALLARATADATTWQGRDSLAWDEHLDSLEQQLQARLTFAERDDLWGRALEHR